MAKKINNRLDSDFDLDSGLDSFDFDFNTPEVKDDRKPTTKILHGALKGAKDQVKSPGFIKQAIKNVLPSGYGEAIDLSDKVSETVKGLYDESVADIKPTLRNAKSAIAKLVPADAKMLPKKVKDLLKEWKKEASEEAYGEISEARARDAMLSNTLQEIFTSQATTEQQRYAEQTGKDRLKEGVDLIRHRSVLDAMNRTAIAVSRMDNYQTRITLNYQKKSLELKYRHLFATQDLLAFSKQDSAKRDNILLAISKNTMLPEFVKIKDSENRKQVFKNKLYESMANGLYGDKNKFIEDSLKKVSKRIGEQIKGVTAGIREGLSQVDLASSMTEGADIDVASIGGEMVGDGVASWVGNKVGNLANKALVGSGLDKRLGISKGGNKLTKGIEELPNQLSEFKKSSKYDFDDSMFGGFMRFLQEVAPGSSMDRSTVRAQGKDMDSPFTFTKRADRSLNEIIPGYLARIYREIQVFRTGNTKIGLTDYNHDSGKFLGQDKMALSVLEKIAPKQAVKSANRELDSLINEIDPENKLSEAEREILRKKLFINSAKRNLANKARLADPKQYHGENKQQAKKVAEHMATYLDSLDSEKSAEFSKNYNRLSENIQNVSQNIQEQRDLGNDRYLKKYKAINKSGNIDADEIAKLYLSTEGKRRGNKLDQAVNKPNQGLASTPLTNAADKVRENTTSAMAKGKEAFDAMTENLLKTAVVDVYKAGEESPRILSQLLPEGEYFDKITGKVIHNAKEIKGAVINKANQTVIDTDEIAALCFKHPSTGVMTDLKDIGAITASSIVSKHLEATKKSMGNMFAQAKSTFMNTLMDDGKPKDIYVDGEATPRLVGIKMAAGEYMDAATGAAINSFEDIKGAVKDSANATVLTLEDLPRLRVWNVQVAAWSPLRLAKSVLEKAWHYQTKIAPKWAAANLKFLWKATKFTTKLGAKMLGGVLGVKLVKDEPKDVYVRGREGVVLVGYKFAQGAYKDAETDKTIWNHVDIEGPVKDAATGQILVAEEDLDALYTLDSLLGKYNPLKLIGWLAKAPFRAAKWLGKKALNFTFNTAPKIAMAGLKILGNAAGLVGKALMVGMGLRMGPQDIYVVGHDFKTPTLNGIRMKMGKYVSAITGKRIFSPNDIDGPVKDAETGQEIVTQEDFDKGMYTQDGVKVKTKPGLFSTIGKGLGAVASFLNPKVKTKLNVKARGKNTSPTEALGVKQVGLLEQIRDSLRSANNPKKIRKGSYEDELAQEKERDDAAAKEKDKLKGLAGAAAGNTKKEAKEDEDSGGGILGGIKNYLVDKIGGKVLGRLGLGRLAGVLGMGGAEALTTGGIAAAGSAAAGSAAAGTAAGVAGAAAAETAAVGGAAAAAGAGGLLAGAGSAAAAIGGGLLTFISSPVVLGAAAVGLAAYGGYKLYKHLNRGSLSALAKVRMVQYGFMPEDTDNIKKAVDLESIVSDLVKDNPAGADLDYKKVKEKGKSFVSAFGLDPEDSKQSKLFWEWFQNRFKPVFLTHMSALKGMGKKFDLGQIDGFKPEEKEKYLKAVAFSEGPYSFNSLPVLDDKTKVANSSDVQAAVKAAQEENAGKDKESKDGKSAQAEDKASVGAAAAPGKAGETTNLGKATLGQQVKTPTIASGAVSAINENTLSDGSRVSAFDTVRFKAYGLTKLEPDKVKALQLLEKKLSTAVKYDGLSGASWSGDSGKLLDELKGSFGIMDLFSPEANEWLDWFNSRFLPVYVAYLSAVKSTVGKPVEGDPALLMRPDQLVTVAKLLAGLGKIWDIKYSPWPKYLINMDAKSVEENIGFLQKAVKDPSIPEDKAKAPDPKQTTNMADAAKPAPSSTVAGSTPASGGPGAGASNAQSAASSTSPDSEAKPTGKSMPGGDDKTSGSAGATPPPGGGSSSPGTLTMAPGPVVDGRNGTSFLKKGSAKLDQVNPSLAKNFLGMVEEYGTLTGKQTWLTDSFRTRAQQEELKRRKPTLAAEPGTSLHEFGLALDADPANLNEMEKMGLMRKYGFTRPVGGEAWHLEPIGIQGNISGFKQNPSGASAAIDAGLGKGGGGVGAGAAKNVGFRDIKNSEAIANSNVQPSAPPKEAAGSTTGTGGAGNLATQATPSGGGSAPGNNATFGNAKGNYSGASATTAPTPVGKMDSEAKPVATTRSGGADTGGGTASNSGMSGGVSPSNPMANNPADPTVKVPDPQGSGKAGVEPTLIAAAKLVGVDPSTLTTFAGMESGFNPNAKASTSSATGLMQFTSNTWGGMMAKYGSKYGYSAATTPPTDAKASAIMGAHLLKDMGTQIGKATGKPVGVTEAYLGHFLGGGGASSFLKNMDTNPNGIAAEGMQAAAKANQSIFYDGNRPRTYSEIYSLLAKRLVDKAKAFGIPLQAGVPPAGGANAPSASSAEGPTGGGSGVSAGGSGSPGAATSPSSRPVATATSSQSSNASAPRVIQNGVSYPSSPVPMPTSSGASMGSSSSMGDAYGFGGAQQAVNTMPNVGGGFDKSIMANTESILTQQLDVQKQLLDIMTKFVGMSSNTQSSAASPVAGADASQNTPSSAKVESGIPAPNAYQIPKAPISMRRISPTY